MCQDINDLAQQGYMRYPIINLFKREEESVETIIFIPKDKYSNFMEVITYLETLMKKSSELAIPMIIAQIEKEKSVKIEWELEEKGKYQIIGYDKLYLVIHS